MPSSSTLKKTDATDPVDGSATADASRSATSPKRPKAAKAPDAAKVSEAPKREKATKQAEDAQGEEGRKRRRYDSPLRRRRAAETRDRIIAAGADLLHGFPVWNWRALTVRAVARRAGVNERTVYRHFTNERELREAVLARQQQEARVEIDKLTLGNLREITARIFEHVSAFPIEPRTVLDPTLRAAGKRHRALLLNAVTEAAPDWSDADRRVAAAMLDVLWSITSYERLVADWELDPKQAARGVTWVMSLVEEMIDRGEGPPA